MRFIDRKRLPLDFPQLLRIAQRQLIRRKQHIHLQFLIRRSELVGPDHFAGGCRPDVGDHV